jgi:hypothetical protein
MNFNRNKRRRRSNTARLHGIAGARLDSTAMAAACTWHRSRANLQCESTTACLLGNVSRRSRLRLEWEDLAQTVVEREAAPNLHREYRPPWKLEMQWPGSV